MTTLKSIHDFYRMKQAKDPIVMSTVYTYPFARLVDTVSEIDCLLVGDSVAMVEYGYDNTLAATVDMIAHHTQGVAKGTSKFIVADLPFLAIRKSQSKYISAVESLVRAGASAIKVECADQEDIDRVRYIVQSGVPVIGHIGLTTQHIHQLGGFKAQGRDQHSAQKLIDRAHQLVDAGCFSLLLECIPAQLAQQITESVPVATIGIGAGPHTDGQVLVLYDYLGLTEGWTPPKFVKTYLDGVSTLQTAMQAYGREVKSRAFPDITKHCYREKTTHGGK